ncbi:hypothetical protein [Rathayibacter sp. AY1E1]|uniref:hypothetical protein n=1 Tax=Rathayibacter sp. AY1E1 TaxID=2080549 RepID=UPI000CE8153F|nr:hypothetical protein [Rathayibacter sp. AY1E1]PPH52664.1 hypothetical protein C5C67_09320 [Rathayibacter sp. AY1E1]
MTAAARRFAFPRRILSVLRLHLAHPGTVLGWPLLVLLAVLAGNLVIWWLVLRGIGAERGGGDSGILLVGPGMLIVVFLFIGSIQATTATFGLALSYGATRRDHVLGSALAFAALSVLWSAIVVVLGAIEEATGGWWLGGALFLASPLDGPWHERFVVLLCSLLAAFALGGAAGAVFLRWRERGVTAFLLVLGAAALAVVVVVTLAGGRPVVTDVLESAGTAAAAALLLVPAALLTAVGSLVLRRATPRG